MQVSIGDSNVDLYLPTKVGSRWNQMHSSLMVDIYTQLSHARHWYFMQGSQRSCIWYSSSLVKERATVESFWLMPMSNCFIWRTGSTIYRLHCCYDYHRGRTGGSVVSWSRATLTIMTKTRWKIINFSKKTSISIPKKNHLSRLPNFLLKIKMVVNLGLKSTTHLSRLLWGKNIKIYLSRLVDLSPRVLYQCFWW